MARATLQMDLETLLAPIAMEHPAGESLRYEGTYDRIQEARREDDPTLAQGVWKTRLKKADWDEIQALCLEALETRSKDLHIAVWLLEAWLHLYGLAGVREGFHLLTGLCESYWEDLHPAWDDDNPEYRFAPLLWMNDKLSIQLKQCPLTQPASGEGPSYTLADWENALLLESVLQRDARTLQSAEAAGKATQARFLGSASLTATTFYSTLSAELQQVLDACSALERCLEHLCAAKAPSLGRLKDVLLQTQHLVHTLLQERGVSAAAEASPDEVQPGIDFSLPAESLRTAYATSSGPIRSRAEAYRRLAEAAEYLLRTEPHSPAPYLVKRAVAWGSMSLTELLHEFVQNQNDLQAIYTLLGLKNVA
ncbi:MAG: type VI secretion system protein TssA [Candidatus Tectimicrobiota bacterium]